MKRKLTDGARGSGAGAAITRPGRKPRVSKVMRPVGWDISFVGVLPVSLVRAYIRPTCAGHSGSVHCTQAARHYVLRLVSSCAYDTVFQAAQHRLVTCLLIPSHLGITQMIHAAARSSPLVLQCDGP